MKSLITRKNLFLDDSDFSIQKNYFDLSFVHARDMEIGKIYPIGLIRTMPGDDIKCKLNVKAYMESLIKNGFYNFRLNIRAYYSRFSDLDPNSKAIMSGGPDGDYDDTIAFQYFHTVDSFKKPYNNLQDCFGLPLIKNGPLFSGSRNKVSALPYILYDNIVYSYYINSIVEDNIVDYVQNGFRGSKRNSITGLVDNDRLPYNQDKWYCRYFDSIANFRNFLVSHGYPEVSDSQLFSDNDVLHFLYNVNYVKDRYTASHISQQLGTPPRLPIDLSTAFNFSSQGSNLPLVSISPDNTSAIPYFLETAGNNDVKLNFPKAAGEKLFGSPVVGNVSYTQNWNEYFSHALQASVTSFSISDMRLAFQTQIIQESIMLGGWEWYQYVKMFFGQDIKDRIPYRPRYLGGIRKPFITSDIFSTVQTDQAPLGSYAGRGQLESDDFLFDSHFEDFGYIMIIAYVDTDGCYYNSQGIKKHWLDMERFNFPNPAFYHLSMQGVERSELYISSATTTLQGDVFGFQPIYNDWRQNDDYVTGSLRDELSFWTSARIFGNNPSLNASFLKVKQTDYDRVFAVSGELFKPFICAFGHSILAHRNLPPMSIPGLIDHR